MKFNILSRISGIIIIVSLSLLGSCKTSDPCPKNPAIGNAGSMFNTEFDEYSPFFFNDNMYFTAIRSATDNSEIIMKSPIIRGEFQPPEEDTTLPLRNYKHGGLPNFYQNPRTGLTEVYFAGFSKDDERANSNIFFSEYIGDKWSNPLPLDGGINTLHYESHPSLAPDGSYILFTSDRPGGEGAIDLYISYRQDNGGWSEPINLGDGINTAQNEISPFIDEDGSLFFASKGYGNIGYDIVRADPSGVGQWTNTRSMSFPVNSEADDTGPAIWRGYLFIASNRRGGCGGKDIYKFPLCGPVIVDGNVESEGNLMPVEGILNVFDEDGNKIDEMEIYEDGKFSFMVEAKRDFVLQYANNCAPDATVQQRISAPCSDSTVVKLVPKFILTGGLNVFNFEEYKVPFFVSGYYYPNTNENLESLRRKFTFNLLGNDEETRYIENPGKKYDKYAPEVEKALDDAMDFLLKIIGSIDESCTGAGDSHIKIEVIGWADPRPISDIARYNDPDIDDKRFGFHVSRGEQMTNDLLSRLRAYYTAKYIESKLKDRDAYRNIETNIKWIIKGQGIDTQEGLSNEHKRRVTIQIGIGS